MALKFNRTYHITNGEASVYDSNGAHLRDSKGILVTITDVTCVTA